MQNIISKVKAGYNQAAKNYSSKFRDQFKNNRHLDLLIEKLEPGAEILDVGCGAGKPIDSYLVDHGFKIIGLDISEAQIELAKKNVPEAEYQVADMSELRAGEFAVDAVVSFYALFHIPREQHLTVLKKMMSFLPKNGYVLLTMGASDWEGTEEFCGAQMFWSHYGAEKNLELLKKAEFKVLFHEIDTTGGEEHLVVLGKK